MKLIYAILTLVFAGSLAWAGPFVSEGPGPVGDILNCTGSKSAFVIRNTAAITIKQGLYRPNRRSRSIKNDVSMECNLNQGTWNCTELSNVGGENLLYARAYKNSQGVTTAQVFQINIAGQEVPVDSLLCR